MTIAVFDVDGTLVGGASTERRFFRWLARHGRIGISQLLAFVWFNLRYLARYGVHTTKKNKAYLAGMRHADVAAAAVQFVNSEIRTEFTASCIERLRRHQSQGDRVVLMTGTLEPIADAIAKLLGADEVIATRCRLETQRYTSQAPLQHPFGQEKQTLFSQRYAPHGSVYAYGDSHHDIALLAAVSHPVCVNPNRVLRRHAIENGWEVLDGSARETIGDA